MTRQSDVDYIVLDRGYETPCWIWQLKVNQGYGHIKHNGQDYHAHIYYYEQYREKLPPYARLRKGRTHELDHLCRVRECVNPWHLELVPRFINVLRGKLGKLINVEVYEVFECYRSGQSQQIIADKLGISQSHISSVLNSKHWRDLVSSFTPVTIRRDRNLKITPEQAREIRLRASSGETQRSLAQEYNLGQSQVSRIVRGEAWSASMV